MRRVLVVPAAGLGTRLRSSQPKVLFPVNGRPLIEYLFERYERWVEEFVLVLHPSFAGRVRDYCAERRHRVGFAIQESPTGMLDAILAARDQVEPLGADAVWVTWCDQIAILPATVTRLAEWAERDPSAAVILPTMGLPEPSIQLERDPAGGIQRVLQRREGDPMPERGEGDMGLFHLSAESFFRRLPAFARDAPAGARTRERNFLPFLAWLNGQARVVTFPGSAPIEAVGVNSTDDLHRVEAALRHDA